MAYQSHIARRFRGTDRLKTSTGFPPAAMREQTSGDAESEASEPPLPAPAPFDGFREECGVFGIFGHPEAANLAYLGLYALQHRGQESAGIAAADGTQVRVSKAMGYVNEAFDS